MNNQKILTDKQDALLQTSRLILQRCAQNEVSIATVPRFVELKNDMAVMVDQIDVATEAKESSRSTKDITKQKNTSVADLINYLDELAIIATGIADDKKNNDWSAKAEKALKKNTKTATEEGLVLIARQFSRFLKTIDTEILTHYGIDNDEVLAIDTKIIDINDWRSRKGMATDQKVLDNRTVAELFTKLEEIKGKMDILSARFKTKAPEFLTVYEKAQTISLKAGAKQGRGKKDTTTTDGIAATNGEVKTTESNSMTNTSENTL